MHPSVIAIKYSNNSNIHLEKEIKKQSTKESNETKF